MHVSQLAHPVALPAVKLANRRTVSCRKRIRNLFFVLKEVLGFAAILLNIILLLVLDAPDYAQFKRRIQ